LQIPLKEEIGGQTEGETEGDFMDNSIVFIANSKGSCSLTFYTFIIKYSFLDLLNFWSNEHLCMLTIFLFHNNNKEHNNLWGMLMIDSN